MSFTVACRERSTGTPEALCQAARAGDIERVRSLISSGVDVNAKTRDTYAETPLDIAFEAGHTDIVELLKYSGGKFSVEQ